MKYKSSKFNILKKGKLYNTLSNNLIIIDNVDILEKVKLNLLNDKLLGNEFTKEEIEILFEGEFIIDSKIDESILVRKKFKEAFFNKKKVNLTYLPTLKCNLNCEYCFEKSLKIKDDLKKENLNEFLKDYLEGVEELSISLFGGEPLLFKERIFDLLNALEKYKDNIKISFSMTTNGTLLTEEIIDKITKNYDLNSVQITLDGTKERHDSVRISKEYKETFDLILNNLLFLKKQSKTSAIVRINLLNDSISQIEKTLIALKKLDMKNLKVFFRKIYSTSSYSVENNIEIEEYYNLALKNNLDVLIIDGGFCETTGHKKNVFLTYDLKAYKCLNEIHEVEEVGYFSKDKKFIFNNKVDKWLDIEANLTDKCYKCKYLPKCFGGCKAIKLKKGRNSCFVEKDFDFDLKYQN